MSERIRSKLTYANVMSTIAIFMVLTGIGFAVAKSLPKKSVGPKQLRNGAVTSRKIRKDAVTSPKIKASAVGRSEIAAGAVSTSEISNQAVTRQKIADSAIPLLGTLRTGQTLRGSFNLGGNPGGVGNDTHQGYFFQFPLNNTPSASQANILDVQANPTAATANCPGVSGGNQQTPNAANGQLCIYISGKTNLGATPLQVENTSRLGFGLVANSGALTSDYVATGYWAVTAP
jgi:hypothetical protein